MHLQHTILDCVFGTMPLDNASSDNNSLIPFTQGQRLIPFTQGQILVEIVGEVEKTWRSAAI
jgi:hypothetical protein